MKSALQALLGCILALSSSGALGGDSKPCLEAFVEAMETEDYGLAWVLCELGAENGLPKAQNVTGIMLKDGLAGVQNYEEAFDLFSKAAEQGHANAQHNLAGMYEEGLGTAKDYRAAAEWYQLAAQQGVIAAQHRLGIMYQFGKGVSKNNAEAARLYKQAAEQGYPFSQFALGVLFWAGDGLPQNYELAHMWLNIANSSGMLDAQKERQALENSMTPAQISSAQERARLCRENAYQNCHN